MSIETPIVYLITPPTTYSGGIITNDCNLGDTQGLTNCPASARLTDGVTDEEQLLMRITSLDGAVTLVILLCALILDLIVSISLKLIYISTTIPVLAMDYQLFVLVYLLVVSLVIMLLFFQHLLIIHNSLKLMIMLMLYH